MQSRRFSLLPLIGILTVLEATIERAISST